MARHLKKRKKSKVGTVVRFTGPLPDVSLEPIEHFDSLTAWLGGVVVLLLIGLAATAVYVALFLS